MLWGIFCGDLEVFGLGAGFLTANGHHEFCQVVFFPLAPERLLRRGRDDHHVGRLAQLLDAPADEGERRHAFDHVGHGGVDRFGPLECPPQPPVARLFHRLFQCRVAQLRLTLDPVEQALGDLDLDASGLYLGTFPEPLERLDQCRKAVDPSALGVKVDELRGLAGVLAHTLEIPAIDRVRNEALLVLQLHGVKRASVGVDTYQVVVLWFDVEHWSCQFSVFSFQFSVFSFQLSVITPSDKC